MQIFIPAPSEEAKIYAQEMCLAYLQVHNPGCTEAHIQVLLGKVTLRDLDNLEPYIQEAVLFYRSHMWIEEH